MLSCFNSGQISVGRTPGPHKVRFELADSTHQVIASKTIDKVTNYGGSTLIPLRTLPQGEQMAILRDSTTFGDNISFRRYFMTYVMKTGNRACRFDVSSSC